MPGCWSCFTLRPDPLLEARRRLGLDPLAALPRVTFADGLRAVRVSRLAVLGLVAIALGHTVMVSVMVMTPVHMPPRGEPARRGAGHQRPRRRHVRAVPLVGWLADRWGRVPVVVLGQAVLLAAVVVAGTAPPHAHQVLGAGLFLLGLGWSCALVAGSTLLSESVASEVRTGVLTWCPIRIGRIWRGSTPCCRSWEAGLTSAGVCLIPPPFRPFSGPATGLWC